MKKSFFINQLLKWYEKHQRHLPWRNTKDPYKIWLSEIILQQTKAMQGLPYYDKFITIFPTIQDLAQTTEEAVLRIWQGLGYYTRARNLHACAKTIVTQYHGIFPTTYQDLLQLKGIGSYTAAAIASIAFQQPIAVVDGNVYRVLSRIFGIVSNISLAYGKKKIHTLAQSLIAHKTPDTYNQAIMEFGALQCIPHNPPCTVCIFKHYCIAFQTQRQHTLPIIKKKQAMRQRYFHYVVIQNQHVVYMRHRKDQDIWQGLYDFYLVETTKSTILQCLEDELVTIISRHNLHPQHNPYHYEHQLTHQKLFVNFYHITATPSFIHDITPLLQQRQMLSCTLSMTKKLPKPILVHNFLQKIFY